jgi:hypothetical protein
MEGHFLQPGNLSQAMYVVSRHWMQCSKDRAEISYPGTAALDAVLVKVIAEDIYPVGAGQVIALVAVKIRRPNAVRRADECTRIQMLANKPAELKWHTVARRELQIGEFSLRFAGLSYGAGEALGVEGSEALEGTLAQRGYWFGCAVGPKEVFVIVFIKWHPLREAAAHACMTGKRGMFGSRELDTAIKSGCSQRHEDSGEHPQNIDWHYGNFLRGNGIAGE